MKWIKASERLPDKRHNYHVKVDYEIDSLSGTWNTASLWNGEFWEHPTKYDSWTGKPSKLNVAQWLDESQSLSTETGQQGVEENDAFNRQAWKSWEDDQMTNPNPVNPQAYTYGYKIGFKAALAYKLQSFTQPSQPQDELWEQLVETISYSLGEELLSQTDIEKCKTIFTIIKK